MNVMPHSTVMMGVPPYYMRLLERNELEKAAVSMRLFISGSAPMLPQTHAAWKAATGKMVLERYGMTECSMIASNPYFEERRPNSVGFPLPDVSIRIMDTDTGVELPKTQPGMIQIKGPNLFAGYWRKPEKTAEDMTKEGYFISGDFGQFDEDGYLYILCRAKDAILSKQGVIQPKEVEQVIDEVPQVDESAVISVPHPTEKARPVAVVRA